MKTKCKNCEEEGKYILGSVNDAGKWEDKYTLCEKCIDKVFQEGIKNENTT